MDEIRLANFVFIGFWLLLVMLILFFGKRWSRMRGFRDCMLAQWKAALAISALFWLGNVLGGRGALNPYALAIFCEALVGLALARGGLKFEPLPVAQAVARKESPARSILLALLFSVLAAAAAILIGSIGLGVAQQVFHETNRSQAASGFAPGLWQAFWLFLAGGGIAEETLFRLVALSAFWRLTRRPWAAVLLSALLFGAYHLTPLNGMYRVFLQFPASQVLASMLVGLVWGWVYIRRGYGTAVLAHTLSDWLPMLLFQG